MEQICKKETIHVMSIFLMVLGVGAANPSCLVWGFTSDIQGPISNLFLSGPR